MVSLLVHIVASHLHLPQQPLKLGVCCLLAPCGCSARTSVLSHSPTLSLILIYFPVTPLSGCNQKQKSQQENDKYDKRVMRCCSTWFWLLTWGLIGALHCIWSQLSRFINFSNAITSTKLSLSFEIHDRSCGMSGERLIKGFIILKGVKAGSEQMKKRKQNDFGSAPSQKQVHNNPMHGINQKNVGLQKNFCTENRRMTVTRRPRQFRPRRPGLSI